MSVSLWVLVIMICISMFLFYKIPETFVNVEPEEYVTIIPNFLTRDECESLAAAAMTKSLEDSEVGGGTESDPAKLDLDSRRSQLTSRGDHPVHTFHRAPPVNARSPFLLCDLNQEPATDTFGDKHLNVFVGVY